MLDELSEEGPAALKFTVTWKGEKVWAIPYDYKNGCDEAPDVCLGAPYFDWGPAYFKAVKDFQTGTWKPSWDWNGPDWKDINNPDTIAIGPHIQFEIRVARTITRAHAIRCCGSLHCLDAVS